MCESSKIFYPKSFCTIFFLSHVVAVKFSLTDNWEEGRKEKLFSNTFFLLTILILFFIFDFCSSTISIVGVSLSEWKHKSKQRCVSHDFDIDLPHSHIFTQVREIRATDKFFFWCKLFIDYWVMEIAWRYDRTDEKENLPLRTKRNFIQCHWRRWR